MRVVTYPSYGSVLPIALEKFLKSSGCDDLRTDPKLLEFIDKSILTYESSNQLRDLDVLIQCPEYTDEPDSDGIKRVYYRGWSRIGCEIRVCVNEYDEKTMKVMIEDYDGSERLSLLKEYVPVESIPGLYVREDLIEVEFPEDY